MQNRSMSSKVVMISKGQQNKFVFRKRHLLIVAALIVAFIWLYRYVTASAHQVAIYPIKDEARTLAFSPDSQLLAVAYGDYDPLRGGLELYNIETNQKIYASRYTNETLLGISPLTFSPDGRSLVAAVANLHNGRTGQYLRELPLTVGGPLCFSNSGKLLAAGGINQVTVLNISSYKVRTFKRIGHISAVAFSPDDTTLASGGKDNAVRLWDVAQGRLKKTLNGHKDDVKGVAYIQSEGQPRIVSVDQSATVLWWDAVTGKLEKRMVLKDGFYNEIALAPEASLYAGGNWATDLFENAVGWVDIRDLRTNQTKCKIEGLRTVNAVALSPNGKYVAIGGRNEVQVWRLK